MFEAVRRKLSIKLTIPLILCGIAVVLLMNVLTSHLSGVASERLVKQQAKEYTESFLMAVEVNSSHSTVVRTINSLGTYRGISEILVVEQRSGKVIAANKSKFVGRTTEGLPAPYQTDGLNQVLVEGGETFTELGDSRYLFAYRTMILSEDRGSTSPIVIAMVLTADGFSGFLQEFTAAMTLSLELIFICAIVVFYLILKLTLLDRIEQIVHVIRNGSINGEARLGPVDSKDELGTLVLAYNNAVLREHERKKELMITNETLRELSHADALTGVSNRRNFDRACDDEWKRAIRQKQPITLLMIDVDHFKDFNDQYGHLAGDECLRVIAATLQQQLKRPGDLLSRYGGEEFAVILPDTADHSNVVAESCRSAVEELVIDVGPEFDPVRVTVSIGVAYEVPGSGSDLGALLQRADRALYQAKQDGRNRVMCLAPHALPETAAGSG